MIRTRAYSSGPVEVWLTYDETNPVDEQGGEGGLPVYEYSRLELINASGRRVRVQIDGEAALESSGSVAMDLTDVRTDTTIRVSHGD